MIGFQSLIFAYKITVQRVLLQKILNLHQFLSALSYFVLDLSKFLLTFTCLLVRVRNKHQTIKELTTQLISLVFTTDG